MLLFLRLLQLGESMNLAPVKSGRRGRPCARVLDGLLSRTEYHTCFRDESVFDFFPGSDLFRESVKVVCGNIPARVLRSLASTSSSDDEDIGCSVRLRFSDPVPRFNRVYDDSGKGDIFPLFFVSFVRP